jgi:hypothetical protein
MLISFFLFVLVSWQQWPITLGPYTHEECLTVKEFLDRKGYDVSSCGIMSVPQEDSIKLEVPYIPTQQNRKNNESH